MTEIAFSENKIESVSSELFCAAQMLWQQNASGIWTVKVASGGDIDFFKALSECEFDNGALTNTFLKEVSEIGVNSFAEYGKGNNAAAVLSCEANDGHRYVIRFSEYSPYELRAQCPLMLQPHRTWEDETHKIELMPLVPMIDASNGFSPRPERQEVGFVLKDPRAVSGLMDYVLRGSYFRFNGSGALRHDMAIFPNGVPVNVDPGQVRQPRRDVISSIEKSLVSIFEKLQKADFPEQLTWMDSDKTWAQHKFFPNPFS